MLGRHRSVVAALLGLFATGSLAAAPIEVVRDCAASAPVATGLKNFTAACPELESALSSLGLDKVLFEGWREKLSSHALKDAVEMNERYSAARWHGAPDVSAVPGIVQVLNSAQAPPVVSWWISFKNWLKKWLESSDSALAKWIKHLLDDVLGPTNVSPAFINGFVYLVTLLAALGAAIVVFRELKAAGVLERLWRRRANPGAPNDAGGSLVDAAAESFEMSAPSGLLRALVRRLLETGRLGGERSLTHRELISRASFDSEGQHAVFGAVARLAETVLYGSKPAAPEDLQSVTRRGRELLQQIHAIESPR